MPSIANQPSFIPLHERERIVREFPLNNRETARPLNFLGRVVNWLASNARLTLVEKIIILLAQSLCYIALSSKNFSAKLLCCGAILCGLIISISLAWEYNKQSLESETLKIREFVITRVLGLTAPQFQQLPDYPAGQNQGIDGVFKGGNLFFLTWILYQLLVFGGEREKGCFKS